MNKTAAGFTLLEVLISLTLISLIMVIMAGALRVSYRSVEKGEARSAYVERLKAAFSLIDEQVQSAIPLTRREDEEGRLLFEGATDRTKFASNFSLTGGKRGYVVVTYTAKRADDGTLTFLVEENTVGIDNPKEFRLLDGMSGIRFEYYRKENEAEGTTGEWVETWTDGLLFPRKIRVTLTFPDRKIAFTVPVRATRVTT